MAVWIPPLTVGLLLVKRVLWLETSNYFGKESNPFCSHVLDACNWGRLQHAAQPAPCTQCALPEVLLSSSPLPSLGITGSSRGVTCRGAGRAAGCVFHGFWQQSDVHSQTSGYGISAVKLLKSCSLAEQG